MFKDKEIKKLVVALSIFYIILLFGAFTITNIIINNYRTYFINYNAKVINIINDKYPSAKEEVIDLIVKGNNYDKTNLEKYGITDKQLIRSIDGLSTEYHNVFNIVVIFTILIIIGISMLIYIYINKLYKKISNLNSYTLDILNNKTKLEIIENEESQISILKNHLYDITRLLKENNNLLEQDKKYLKDALADISHQIKTPLTSLYLLNEILYQEKDQEQQNIFLDKMRLELERIEWLVSSLLKISKIDSGTINFKDEKINLNELINEVIKSLYNITSKKEVLISVKNNSNLYIKGDFNWLKEALINIIKNCIEHVSLKGVIDLNYEDNPIYTKIIIKDNGEGIDKKDLPHIFERFYKAKNSSKDSIGIGLSLAKSIINKHNGCISVKSIKNKYTVFEIKLYKQ